MTPSSPAPSKRRNQSAGGEGSRVAGEGCTGGAAPASTTRWTEPSRLLEVCCGRGGGLAYLHAKLLPGETIGIDRSLAAIRHGRNVNAMIAHLHGHAVQLPLREASIDLAVNVEALADVPKLPFLAEICRVLTAKGVFAVADTMPHRPEACCI